MNILHLTLTKEWFNLISTGEKKEEYREIKPYWDKRLNPSKNYTHIKFKNGYSRTSPEFIIELKSIKKGLGKKEWGAEKGITYYILELGKTVREGIN